MLSVYTRTRREFVPAVGAQETLISDVRSYIVYERDRFTYSQLHQRACTLASVLSSQYHVRRGDRGEHTRRQVRGIQYSRP